MKEVISGLSSLEFSLISSADSALHLAELRLTCSAVTVNQALHPSYGMAIMAASAASHPTTLPRRGAYYPAQSIIMQILHEVLKYTCITSHIAETVHRQRSFLAHPVS